MIIDTDKMRRLAKDYWEEGRTGLAIGLRRRAADIEVLATAAANPLFGIDITIPKPRRRKAKP